MEAYDTGEYETVYNCRVADYHTYFAGDETWTFSVWAHHAACAIEIKDGKYRLRNKETGRLLRGKYDTVEQAIASATRRGHTITLRGSEQGAAQLQSRAEELNAMRRAWEANNGTTAVIKVQNKVTGEVKTLIATEGKVMPKEFVGKLRPSEEFIGDVGHAEQTILQNLGPDWVTIEGGASRNVCKSVCQPLVEGSGMKLGGSHFKGASDKTPFRMFWRE
ncbi:MAG: hypothetical protein SNJ82_08745 [Gemmataceae bacterium]